MEDNVDDRISKGEERWPNDLCIELFCGKLMQIFQVASPSKF